MRIAAAAASTVLSYTQHTYKTAKVSYIFGVFWCAQHFVEITRKSGELKWKKVENGVACFGIDI